MRLLTRILFSFMIVQSLAAYRSAPPDGKYNPEALDLVLSRVKESVKKGEKPVVLFDLDETLVNSRTRTLRILRNFATFQSLRERYPKETNLIMMQTADEATIEKRALKIESFVLYPKEILLELGVFNDKLAEDLRTTYTDAYLSDSYCALDNPMPGAVEYVRKVREAGAFIVYVTGRNRPGMSLCTVENLMVKGFPGGTKDTALLMKETRDSDDTAFKELAMRSVKKYGVVVAGFENEPANLNVFHNAFPDGTYVFVDSMHSKRPDQPFKGALYIRDFLPSKEKVN